MTGTPEAPAWRVAVTSHNFYRTPEPTELLRLSGCDVIDTGYGRDESDGALGGDELVALLAGADAVITGAKMSREVIEASSRLKVISRRGVGYDMVDVETATRLGVVLTVTYGALDSSVADHAYALMFAAARKVVQGHNTVRTGGWGSHVGLDVWGKTLGIVGLGRIGRAVAERASGFRMPILAYDLDTDLAFAHQHGVTYVCLEELVSRSDFISVNASLNAATRHMIGVREFQAMKRDAVVVNTGRGGLIDEQALLAALREGHIFGAGLDTFEVEPPGSLELGDLNLVLSPHMAGATREALVRANLAAAQNVVDLMSGQIPQGNVINPAAIPAASWLAER